jgi:hypothetical protein
MEIEDIRPANLHHRSFLHQTPGLEPGYSLDLTSLDRLNFDQASILLNRPPAA